MWLTCSATSINLDLAEDLSDSESYYESEQQNMEIL